MKGTTVRINQDMIEKSKFIKTYKKEMLRVLRLMYPERKPKELESVLNELIEEQAISPSVVLDNNYTHESRESTLLSVLDWAMERKPIIAGNGTFYKNQHEEYNPAAVMLDGFLVKRKKLKGLLFQVKDAISRQYQDLDRKQGNQKINANSYYGGSGAKTSAFYSLYSGPATTLSAQSVISTTETMFESFLGDNYVYLDINEWMDWVDCVLEEYKEHPVDLSCLHPISSTELNDRMANKILNVTDEDLEIIDNTISHLSAGLTSFLFYKNNFLRFIEDHPFIQEKLLKVYDSVLNLPYIEVDKHDQPLHESWVNDIPKEFRESYLKGEKGAKDWNKLVNHKYFIDPNKPPEEIMGVLTELNQYMMEFVYTRYMAFDRIYRLKNMYRKTVTVIDTDSNILSLDTIIEYLIARYFPNTSNSYYGRSYANNVYISINMVTYFITQAVTDILLSYGKYSNIPEEYRSRYSMKNEFMFAKLIIGETKKRYISNILLREGNIMNPPKVDIKGFDFKKATYSEYAETVFKSIIKNRVLGGEEVDLQGMLADVYGFRAEIYNSIQSGDKRFLPNGNAKEIEGYKNPNSISTVKAVQAWNLIHPDISIEIPSKVSLVKMNIFDLEDIAPLKKTHPEIYERIERYIFNDDTGMFVKKSWVQTGVNVVHGKHDKWWEKIPKKYQKEFKAKGQKAWNNFVTKEYDGPISNEGCEKYECKGLLILAIPSKSQIPEWAIPYIDMKTMVNNILAPFLPVLKIFKIRTLEEGKSKKGVDRKTEGISRMVKF